MAFRQAYGNFPSSLENLAQRASTVEVKSMKVEDGRIVFEVLSHASKKTEYEDHEYTVILDPAGTPQTGWCKHIEKCAETLILPVTLGR